MLRGDYIDNIRHESLPLSLKLGHEELERNWAHVGETADYLIQYLKQNQDTGDRQAINQRNHDSDKARVLNSSANYIANELLENAIKYAQGGKIRTSAGIEDHHWVILVSHETDSAHRAELETFIDTLETSDADELMTDRIMSNANAPDGSGSGLGLLSIVADHKGRVGWKFDTRHDRHIISTMVRLNLAEQPGINQ